MNNKLIVVDMQNDFIIGTLGTKEAENIIANVTKKIKEFDGEVIYTRDSHDEGYLTTNEGKNLPVVHCIKESSGWQLHPQIDELRKSMKSRIFDKPTFGSLELAMELAKENEENKIDRIEFCGICTDICVISNVMLCKAFLPEVEILVDSACCAGVTPKSHQTALEAMKACQVRIE